VVTSATDGTHKLWDLASARGLATMDGCSCGHSSHPCLSSDGRWLVCGMQEGGLLVWRLSGANEPSTLGMEDTPTGNWERRVEGRHSYPITALALADDDTALATADESGTIKISSAWWWWN
jgi:WD40 repeat protein